MRFFFWNLIFLFCLGCGINPAFKKGESLYSQGNYLEALTPLKRGLKDEPQYLKYKIMLKLAMRKGGRKIYQKATKAKDQDYLHKAEGYLRKALDLDPQNELYLNLQSQIDKTKNSTKKIYREAKAYLDQKKWDRAFSLLDQIYPLHKTYSFIEKSWEEALNGSFVLHNSQGKNFFLKGDYNKAIFEFKLALERKPASKDTTSWYQKSLAYSNAKAATAKGNLQLKQKKYSLAYAMYTQALKVVPSYRDALVGKKKSLQGWAGRLLVEGREKLKKAQGKYDLHLALDKFLLCNSKVQDYQDVSNYIQKTKKRLAQIYFDEGLYFLQFPNLTYISLSYRCFLESEELDSSFLGLKKQLIYTRKLYKIRKNRYLNILIENKIIRRQLGVRLAKRLSDLKISSLSIHNNSQSRQLDLLVAKLNQLGYKPKQKKLLPLEVITLELALRGNLKESKTREKIFSSYLAGFHKEVRYRWDTVKKKLEQNQQKYAQYIQKHSSDISEQQAAKINLAKKEAIHSSYSKRYALYSALYNGHINRVNYLKSISLLTGAQRELFNANAMVSKKATYYNELDRARSLLSDAKRRSSKANRRVSITESEIRSTERAIERDFYYLHWKSREKRVPTIQNYSFLKNRITRKGHLQIFGKVKSNFFPKAILSPKVDLVVEDRALHVTGVKSTDRGGNANHPFSLASQREYMLLLKEKSLNKLLNQIVDFLYKYHIVLFKQAEKFAKVGRVLEALEFFQLFISIDKGRNQDQYKRAKKYLKSHLRFPLKREN